MREWLYVSASRLWPALAGGGRSQRAFGTAIVWQTLLAIPLSIIALVWLILVSDFNLFVERPLALLILFILRGLLAQADFASFGTPYDVRGSQGRLVIWSGVLVLGPTVLWLELLGALFDQLPLWRRRPVSAYERQYRRWYLANRLLVNTARELLPALVAVTLYTSWGGAIPLTGLANNELFLALAATLVKIGIFLLITIPLFAVFIAAASRISLVTALRGARRYWESILVYYLLPEPFAVLAAGLYALAGAAGYLFLIAGYLVVIWLFQRLRSRHIAAENRSQQLNQLEHLSRDLMTSAVDEGELAVLLEGYLPKVFPAGLVEIRLIDHNVLYRSTPLGDGPPDSIWSLLAADDVSYVHFHRHELPGEAMADLEAVLLPIFGLAAEARFGWIFVARSQGPIMEWLNGVMALAGQIAAALDRSRHLSELIEAQSNAYREEVFAQAYQAEVYAQSLAYEKMHQELQLAGRIQSSFLPQESPDIPGWQLTVTLEPAREASGDYYDFIPLDEHHLGILVADVADKGVGAALYMALSRTIIRTYAPQFVHDPDRVLEAANRRILAETSSDLFVTVFYCVLNTKDGRLTYCNAGHNPPFLLRADEGAAIELLSRTALPLGILEDVDWDKADASIEEGDVLTLYTDGITEAQDEDEEFFGEKRLWAVVQRNSRRSAEVIEDQIISSVLDFIGDTDQADDITLVVLTRRDETKPSGADSPAIADGVATEASIGSSNDLD